MTATGVRDGPASPSGQSSRTGRAADSEVAAREARTERRRVWGLVVLLLVAALAAAFRTGTAYSPGDRFELFWSPWTTFSRALSSWDGVRGLGVASPQFAPVVAAFTGVLRSLGLSPGVVERLFHATLLATAGTGAVGVLRCFRRRVGIEHLAAGLLYMFNPFAAVFLNPALLFVNYALAPWFLVAFVHGTRGPNRWRWAAVFALLFFVPGSSNLPATLWALLPILPMAWYLVSVERSATIRGLLHWSVRAAVLTVLVSAAALIKISIGSNSFATNLESTESAQAVSVASSWSESWRGLGFWLSYWIDARGVIKPETEAYFRSLPVVLASFAAPIAAWTVIWRSHWRPRLVFGAIALISLVAMTGAYPFNTPTPFGRLLIGSYEGIPGAFGFRNTYKAGPGLALGVALLCGVGIAAVLARCARRGTPYVATFVCVVVVVFVAASIPFWSGDLYTRASALAIPGYYHDASAWLDQQSGDSRVLVLPGTSITRYRWGNPGDDILDAELDRPHVARAGQPLSAPETNTVIDALVGSITDGSYTAGTLAPIARRLGIEYVLVRNDLDWQSLQVPRPQALDELRNDRSLTHARSFGKPGENVARARDHSSAARAERGLRPVEILRVPGASDAVRTVTAGPPLLVSGDGAAWPSLARSGALDSGRGLQFTGDLGAAKLRAALSAGSSLVVTDTNRRQVSTVGAFGPQIGATLTASQTPARGIRDIFRTAGSQTVASWSDATMVSASPINAGLPIGDASDPANAFDDDPNTSWLTGALTPAVGQRLTVRFGRPTRISRAALEVANPCCAGRTVSHATLRFSDGTIEPATFRGTRRTELAFAPRLVRWIEVRIDGARGGGARPLGFTEISFPGVDLRRFTQLPDDVFRRAAHAPRLTRLLQTAPVTYSFARDDVGPDPGLRRRFRTAGDRAYAAGGVLRLSSSTSEGLLDRLVGAQVGAYSTGRSGGALDGGAIAAIDGRTDTSWTPPATDGASIVSHFTERLVSSVGLVMDAGPSSSRLTRAEIHIGDLDQTVDLSQTCTPVGTRDECLAKTEVSIPPTRASTLTVVVKDVATRSGPVGAFPLHVNEITLNGQPNAPIDLDAHPPACVDVGMTADGQPMPVTIDSSLRALLDGQPARFSACSNLELGAGWHSYDGGTNVAAESATVSTVRGAPSGVTQPGPDVAEVRTISNTGTKIVAKVTVPPGGTTLVTNRSFARGWTASADGRDLGEPAPVDAQIAWRLTKPGTYLVEVKFAPEQRFRVALFVTAGALLLCALLVVRRRPPAHPAPAEAEAEAEDPARSPSTNLVVAAVVTGLSFLVGGFPGALIGICALAATRIRSPEVVAAIGLGMLIVAAIATVVEAPLDLGPDFASNRPIAAWTGLASGVLLLVAIIEFANRERAARGADEPTPDSWISWKDPWISWKADGTR